MIEPDYEYHGLMAATWDLFRGDTSNWEDRAFFLEVIRRAGQPVLDVGCGTGRLLLDYLAQGIDIDGMDNSPDMLGLLLEKALAMNLQPQVYQQKMEALDLPRRYRLIMVPSSSFQLLLEPAQARQAMSRFYTHLEPGGALAMPFLKVWPEGEPLEQTEWKLTGEATRPEDGALVQRWSRAWYDPEEQLEHTEDRYEIRLDGKLIAQAHHRQSPATRGYTREQALDLYREAGFTDLEVYKGFTFEQADPDDPIFTVIGVRP